MKSRAFLVSMTLGCFLGIQLQSQAQVKPDMSLPTNSLADLQGKIWVITDGTVAGNNLYHSFSDFSIPTGYGAYFNNASQVQNIITRVTGNSASAIDGNLKANGFANVFLINSNGITFGPNATLNIGGSFTGATAKSLLFSDGSQYDTKGTNTPSISINVPTGLIFDDASGGITAQGAGHQLSVENPILSPITGAGFSNGLRASTLNLIGNGVSLQGATVNGDRINIGSVKNGVVKINPDFSVDYSNISKFNDIRISERSAIDASGIDAGAIDLHGKNIIFNGGSTALIQNQGMTSSGALNIFATESLSLEGIGLELFPTRIVTESVATGTAGDINITSPKISIDGGADVTSRTYGSATSGNINIAAMDYVRVNGFAPEAPTLYSFILTGTVGAGSAGNIKITTNELSNTFGGEVGSGSLSDGKAGNIDITAKLVQADNSTPAAFGSAIFTISGAKGDSGNVTIQAKRVNITEGGLISAGTEGDGNGGDVRIVATESINISGVNPYFLEGRSQIISGSATEAVPLIRSVFGLPEVSSGLPGNISITTQNLNIFNAAFIGVSNSGQNSDGANNLKIDAKNVVLDNGFIVATSTPGGGGNIIINSADTRLLNGSYISASSIPKIGGNIDINTNLLTVVQDSEIRANSLNDFGGNVNINAQGLFMSNDSSITATSRLGSNFTGSVNINAPNPNLTPSKLTQTQNPIISELSAPCITKSLDSKSEYIVSGTGGLPSNPDDLQSENRGWGNNFGQIATIKSKPKYVRATGWKKDEHGLMVMITTLDNESQLPTTNCNVP